MGTSELIAMASNHAVEALHASGVWNLLKDAMHWSERF